MVRIWILIKWCTDQTFTAEARRNNDNYPGRMLNTTEIISQNYTEDREKGDGKTKQEKPPNDR